MNNYPFSYFPPVPDDERLATNGQLNNTDINTAIFRNDAEFDWLYPEHFQMISQRHWTPLSIARKAAEFLAEPNAKVLDIGSGIGKFCLAGAHHFPETMFYGVEQREELVHHSKVAKGHTKLPNVRFIHANITQVNFNEFDHFYFYNSFYENIEQVNRIDDTIETSSSLFTYYSQYLLAALSEMRAGTRLVTYQCCGEIVPPTYKLTNFSSDWLLRMYIKA